MHTWVTIVTLLGVNIFIRITRIKSTLSGLRFSVTKPTAKYKLSELNNFAWP